MRYPKAPDPIRPPFVNGASKRAVEPPLNGATISPAADNWSAVAGIDRSTAVGTLPKKGKAIFRKDQVRELPRKRMKKRRLRGQAERRPGGAK